MNEPDARTTGPTRVYQGRFINVDLETFRNPAGKTLSLEIIHHPGAAAVVPVVDPDVADPEILLLRQFRHAAGGVIWEIPAGVLEPGENPEACARRELREETGAEAARIDRLSTIFTTPGFTDERIHLFRATGLTIHAADPQPDEFIRVERLPFSETLQLIRTGDIADGKSIAALLFLGTFGLNA